MPPRPPGAYANYCRSCKQDFGSTGAFDAHRTGRHEYTFTQGLAMEPERLDGRRCLDTEELEERGWRRDRHGRWRTPASGKALPPQWRSDAEMPL